MSKLTLATHYVAAKPNCDLTNAVLAHAWGYPFITKWTEEEKEVRFKDGSWACFISGNWYPDVGLRASAEKLDDQYEHAIMKHSRRCWEPASYKYDAWLKDALDHGRLLWSTSAKTKKDEFFVDCFTQHPLPEHLYISASHRALLLMCLQAMADRDHVSESDTRLSEQYYDEASAIEEARSVSCAAGAISDWIASMQAPRDDP